MCFIARCRRFAFCHVKKKDGKPVKLVWNSVSGILEQPNVVYDILYNGYSCAGAVVFEIRKYDLPLIIRGHCFMIRSEYVHVKSLTAGL